MAEFEKIMKDVRSYSVKSGYPLNPNAGIVEAIVKGLARNKETKGEAFCPCRPITGKKEIDRKSICPCTYHPDEIRRNGKCHCGLYVSREFAEKNR